MPGPGSDGEKCDGMPVPVQVEDMTAGPMIPPTPDATTGGPALPPPTLETTGGPALPPPVPAVATEASALVEAEGDVPVSIRALRAPLLWLAKRRRCRCRISPGRERPLPKASSSCRLAWAKAAR